ncbi:hypothetical protein [Microvirga sp. M2]|uniref:hypothetical protein n=1 Tax=Microvirga sp. M2 TaxID=3073270 RepID=UPI0039C1C369
MITAIIVIQSNVGSSLKVAFDQFAGSLLAAVYASVIVLAIAPDDLLSSTVAPIFSGADDHPGGLLRWLSGFGERIRGPNGSCTSQASSASRGSRHGPRGPASGACSVC